MENHLHGGILLVYENRMVRAVVEKHAKTLRIEVILVGHLHGKIGAEQAWAGSQGQDQGKEETHFDSAEHRLDEVAPSPQHYMTGQRLRAVSSQGDDFEREF